MLLWTQPDWLDEVTSWVDGQLERLGLQRRGPGETTRTRPWSTVVRVPTSAGDVYFKATAPTLAYEAALMETLARRRPDCLPEILATDRERGWILMSDGGVSLRSLLQAERDLRRWQTILPRYAGLQIELSDRLPELLALGVPDRRLATLPMLYDQMLADTDALLVDQPNGLTSEEHQHLRAFAPQFAAMCARLADYGLPETLDHSDFHDGNIFVREDHAVFLDWGDSGLTHPFFTLNVTLLSLTHTLQLEENAPERTQLCDLYLDAWTRYGSRETLREALQQTQPLGIFLRVLAWRRALSDQEDPLKSDYANVVPTLLQDLLSDK